MADSTNQIKIKKAISTIVYIIGGMLIAFLCFVYIGNACGLEIAQKIAIYLEENLGIVVSVGSLIAMFGAYKKLTSMDVSSDSIKGFAATSISELSNAKISLDDITSKLEEKVKGLDAVSTDVNDLKDKQDQTNEKLGQVTDILLYFVLDGNKNEKVEELKAYFEQSEIMKAITEMKNVASDSASSEEMVDAAINTAANEIRKVKAKQHIS